MIYGKRDGWKHQWSRWFAWHPVTLIDGRMALMTTVERISWHAARGLWYRRGFGSEWYYREIEK